MAFPFSPKPPPFTATTLIKRIRPTFRELPDSRRGGNHQRYAMEDAALSAFAVFFTQHPSFLDYQRRMQRRLGRNKAHSLFGVHKIPSEYYVTSRPMSISVPSSPVVPRNRSLPIPVILAWRFIYRLGRRLAVGTG